MEDKLKDTLNKYPVTLEGDTITCYALFDEALLKKSPDEDKTYADLCCRGIEKYWGDAGFEVRIIRVKKGDRRPHINVLPAKLTGTSYVMSRWWRWGWGLFRSSFHPESFMINWSRRNPGNIHLNIRSWHSTSWFMRVSAHEFGHILGLGDAYAAHYRFYYEAPGTEDYMMNRNRRVSPEEALMVRRAQETGRMQYFPIKFSAKRYIKGLRKRL
ncbi:MAG: hypothetical protein IJ757_00340 [Clostridiales bacterium]|nr:hypothetical protein [Clostridiales bacterium]